MLSHQQLFLWLNFANKYIIKGESDLTPAEFFNRIYDKLKGFFNYHRNIKFNMLLVCIMEQQLLSTNQGVVGLKEDKSNFTLGIHINLESTDVDELIEKCIIRILDDLDAFSENGSGRYFKEVVQLEIHTVKYNPTGGGGGRLIFLFQIG